MPVAPLPFLFLQMEQLQNPLQGGQDQEAFISASLQSSPYLDTGLGGGGERRRGEKKGGEKKGGEEERRRGERKEGEERRC